MTSGPKILMVQLFSNGDCLFATTIARQIKQDYPGCHLTWAIAPFCRSIIENNPYVDAIMEVTSVPKSDVIAFRKFKREAFKKKASGEFDEVFITTNMDTNQALYDGTIRSNILNAYPYPITVPVQPVVNLYEQERSRAQAFAEEHSLNNFSEVVLFEFAPQSGQSKKLTKDFALSVAEKLATNPKTAVILSSAHKIEHTSPNIIDGSALSIRETAALTHYCTFLLGCSSGLTWLSTSSAAKQLPMVQLLNPDTSWVNPISRDFERVGVSTDNLIELIHFSDVSVSDCIKEAFLNFPLAKKRYNEPVPLQFKTTRKIVYNLLCYLEIGAIIEHIKYNRKVYGDNPAFYKEVILGIVTAPFKLIWNKLRK